MITEKNMQHGEHWDGEDVSGWWASEKYDGCRIYWDGGNMWSRGGINIDIPTTWRNQLPVGVHLDGELYDGPDGLYRCTSAVRYGKFLPSMKFIIFDAPEITKSNWEDRMRIIEILTENIDFCGVVDGCEIPDIEWAIKTMYQIQKRGGEGLILRKPNILYTFGRTRDILKLKCIDD